MYAVVVTFITKPGRAAAFLPLIRNNAGTSLKDEPGCRRFDVCTDPEHPDEVFLYEIYDNAAAFEAHCRSRHFIEFNEATASMVASKNVRTYSDVVS